MFFRSFEVAKKISQDSYGLVFGINILVSLIFQSILTYVVTSGRVYILDIRTQVRNKIFRKTKICKHQISCSFLTGFFTLQFVVYAWYFVILAVLFTIMAICTIIKWCRRGENLTVWTPKESSSECSIDPRIDENCS